MKKKLSLTIVSLMCLGVFGLTACDPTTTSSEVVDSTSEVDTTSVVDSVEDTSVVSNPEYNSIAISNKAELQASWKVEDDNRSVKLTIDPVANINVLLSTDMLTVTSSDTAVVTATGLALHVVAAGTATITVTLVSGDSTITDTVELTTEAAVAPISLEDVRAIDFDDDDAIKSVKTRGYVTRIVKDKKYAIIADGDLAVELYYAADYLGDVVVGDLVVVSGTASLSYGMVQIGYLSSIKKIEAADNADVIVPTNLVLTDWDAIPDDSDSRLVTIEGMILTSMPSDYVIGDLGSSDANKAKRYDVGLTLDGKEVIMSVDYHNGWETCDAIYTKLSAVYLSSTVDFNGLLTMYNSEYRISPMSADDITVTQTTMTAAESLTALQTKLGAYDYSAGVYEIPFLPVADTLGLNSVTYAVSSELTEVVTIDAATGEVTIVDQDVAISGTITASIYDADDAMVGDAYVIDVTIKAVHVEPVATAATLAEVLADESGKGALKFTGATGVVSDLAGTKYGNMVVTSGESVATVYGSTASVGEAIMFNAHTGGYYYSNAKDYLENPLTAALVATDTITFDCIRADYGDKVQIAIEITAINGVPTIEEPVEETAFITYDFSTQTQIASSSNSWNSVDDTTFKTALDGMNTEVSQESLLSTTEVLKAYVGNESNSGFNGLKMGSSSTDATFTLNFAAGTNVSKVVVNGIGWNSGSNTLTVGGLEAQTVVNAGEWDAVDAFSTAADYTFDINDADSVTFSGRRVLVNSITIFTA